MTLHDDRPIGGEIRPRPAPRARPDAGPITAVVVAFVLGVVAGVLTWAPWWAPEAPHCPTEDSCAVDYHDGAWHVEEAP